MLTEADTCRKYVLPKLVAAGWDNDPHSFTEQKTFTDGRIVVAGSLTHRRKQKRADYLLRHTRDFAIAVVEAKAAYKSPGDGMQQAKAYAEILGLKFAYSTNGHGIIEFDYLTGEERPISAFPTPDKLWTRLRNHQGLSDEGANRLLTPSSHLSGKSPRYYKVCIVPSGCDGWLMTGHLFRVRFDQQRCEPRFAFAALRGARTIRDQVFGQIRGATRPGFNTTLLGNVELPIPPLSEQHRVVSYLDSLQAKVDALKRLQTETAAELDALLPSVLDKAFKGEL